MSEAPRSRYSPAQRHLHWLVFLLVALAYLAIEQRGLFERGTWERTAMVQAHFWMGLAVMVIVGPRLWLRLRRGAPPITPPLPAWQAWPAQAVHVALYAFLLVQPVLGLFTAWADGKQVMLPLLGNALPSLLAPDEALAHQLEDLHKTIGSVFYWIIGLHILGALFHHFIRRDDTLRRMG